MLLLLLLTAFLLPPGAGAGSPSAATTPVPTLWFHQHRGEIIGGQEARPHSHPYMAYLLIESQNGLRACGGFLVRNDFVLTAAHCWGRTITVILGAHNIQRQERTQQRTRTLRAIRHPNYDPQTNRNDIMLLKLANRARQTSAVRPVNMPQAQARVRPGARCTVAGWGLLGPNRRTNRLHEVTLTVQRESRCSNRFSFYDSQTQICVGNPRERKSAFLGDSGGPLVCNGVAQGIVSYGDRRGSPPAVFTRIGSFIPWVNRTMRRFQ